MPRTPRLAPGGYVYHVLNRGVGRMQLFDDDGDYAAFLRTLAETLECRPMRLLAYCLMPNHWHLLLWPQADGQLASFMQRLTIAHARRWIEYREATGCGHVYQSRYKSFPVQTDAHFLTVARYVERNPLRAQLVPRAHDWPWASLAQRLASATPSDAALSDVTRSRLLTLRPDQWPTLSRWPVTAPSYWLRWVNQPETTAELDALRLSVTRDWPLGTQRWTTLTAARLRRRPLRPPGRPLKTSKTGTGPVFEARE